MKIVFLMHNFYEINNGGAEYQVYMIAEKLIKEGHDINFIFLKNDKEVCKNIYTFDLFPLKTTKHKKLSPLKLLYLQKVFQLLKQIKPDIIYHRDLSSFLFAAQIYKCVDKKVKIMFHVCIDDETFKYKISLRPSKILKSIDDLFAYAALSYTKNVITQTYFQQQMLLKNHNRSSAVIRNFSEPSNNVDYTTKENIIIWIANVKEKKNPFDFIKLANDLKDRQYRFVMIGKPPEGRFRKRFDNALKGANVEYLGEMSNEIVNSFLCKSRILCCTSFVEGFPNTFMQAWTRKVPVVSLYVDPDGLIRKYELGCYSKSYSSLKKDIINLINNLPMLESMGENVREFSNNNFLIHNNFSKFHNYLIEILEN